jgi:hypothetical protein
MSVDIYWQKHALYTSVTFSVLHYDDGAKVHACVQKEIP